MFVFALKKHIKSVLSITGSLVLFIDFTISDCLKLLNNCHFLKLTMSVIATMYPGYPICANKGCFVFDLLCFWESGRDRIILSFSV